jgi:hypothetical protein
VPNARIAAATNSVTGEATRDVPPVVLLVGLFHMKSEMSEKGGESAAPGATS